MVHSALEFCSIFSYFSQWEIRNWWNCLLGKVISRRKQHSNFCSLVPGCFSLSFNSSFSVLVYMHSIFICPLSFPRLIFLPEAYLSIASVQPVYVSRIAVLFRAIPFPFTSASNRLAALFSPSVRVSRLLSSREVHKSAATKTASKFPMFSWPI